MIGMRTKKPARFANDRGAAALELPLAIGMLLIPTAFVVLMLAPWAARANMARLAAAEAARVIVTDASTDPDDSRIRNIVDQIATNHNVPPGEVSAVLCVTESMTSAQKAAARCDNLVRGMEVRVEVTVQIPLMMLPGSGEEVGGFTWTVAHTELVDRFRSFE